MRHQLMGVNLSTTAWVYVREVYSLEMNATRDMNFTNLARSVLRHYMVYLVKLEMPKMHVNRKM